MTSFMFHSLGVEIFLMSPSFTSDVLLFFFFLGEKVVGAINLNLYKLSSGKRTTKKEGCMFHVFFFVLFFFSGNITKHDMDVSKDRGTPKWMVYNGKAY